MVGHTFQPFNHHEKVKVYRRNLPHWRQDGCTYFVTFRLADSIPAPVLRQWKHERTQWLIAHGIQGSLRNKDEMNRYLALPQKERSAFERQQARRLHTELDQCHGSCLLRNSEVQLLVRSALTFFDGTRLACGDGVIMPNHVHWLVLPYPDHSLETIMKSIKSYLSNQVSKLLSKQGKLWQPESYDRLVRNRRELDAFRRYIAENPGHAGLSNSRCTSWKSRWLDRNLSEEPM
ncbi:MAG: transposase [Verrucomicrobia bacterium]|nr:transposase [Kiritimatiellia bacterium]MCP5488446.1 transposase [Verrucomicrobiota bacterium]